MFYKNDDGSMTKVDVPQIMRDLKEDDYELVTISRHGEMVIDRTDDPDYPYRREVYQRRQEGEGVNLDEWGGFRWEFCRSIKLEPMNV